MNTQLITALWRWTCVLLLAVTVAGIPADHSALAQGPTVRLEPVSTEVGVGDTVMVNVRVENVTSLLGCEVHLVYDPTYVDVVDADSGRAGVQIQPGTFVPPDFIPQNTVDLANGHIDFAVSALDVGSAASGSGTVAVITFQGKAAGTSPVTFVDVILADATGNEIPAGTQGGQVVVTSGPAVVPTTGPTDTPAPTAVPANPAAPTPTPTNIHTSAPQQAILSLAPADVTIAPGDSVAIKVHIANVTELYGVDFHLSGGSITVSSIAEGPCIADVVAKKEITNGVVHYAASLQAPSSPFSGDCELATITFVGNQTGTYHLAFGAVTLSTVDGQPIPVTTQNGIIRGSPNSNILCNHVVQPGETLFCIGRGYSNVDPCAIARQNHIPNPNLIYPGQVLAIPAVYTSLSPGPACPAQCGSGTPVPPPCRWYHTVAPGESLYRIALRYGVSMWAIAEANQITNLNYIRVGQRLCIP